MLSLSEIVAAAARLDPDQLQELSRAIERLASQRHRAEFDLGAVTCRMERLTDGEYLDLLPRSLAIEEDYGFGLQLHRHLEATGTGLNFAELYLALTELFGPSGRHFDSWKGAFSFPFALEVIRGERGAAYLLRVHVCRDSLYFPVRKITAPDDERLAGHYYYKPFEGEFSGDDINRLTAFLYGYLRGYWVTVRDRLREPFLRTIPGGLVLFGYVAGRTFEGQYRSTEEFEEAARRYREQVELEGASAAPSDPCVIR